MDNEWQHTVDSNYDEAISSDTESRLEKDAVTNDDNSNVCGYDDLQHPCNSDTNHLVTGSLNGLTYKWNIMRTEILYQLPSIYSSGTDQIVKDSQLLDITVHKIKSFQL